MHKVIRNEDIKIVIDALQEKQDRLKEELKSQNLNSTLEYLRK